MFAYRAFALAYYERHSTFGFMKEHFQIKKQRGDNTEEIEQKIQFYEKHLNFIENLRNSMNSNLDNKRFERISTEVLVWPRNYGVAATSMFFVDKDVQGKVINNPLYYISPFFFTIIPTESNTVVLMSYLTKDKNRYKFLKDQIVKAPLDQQKVLISNILAMNVENFFISPKQWNKTLIEIRQLYTEILKNTMGKEKPGIGHFKKLNIFLDID
ncbi:hypothetical protein [Paenibacillus amylolyticus]|uniref:hypothetical protein n=1 Tax=Paenibacillus amylolyticus TaxID=1451 RepID=UPI000AE07D0B|nr:hypothetical protein [Paenibacillus amylolyticus]